MTTPVHGRESRSAVPGPALQATRRAPGRITGIFAAFLATAAAGCSSTSVVDDHLAGWQREHDAQTHAFAHDSFALNRQASEEAARLAGSGSLLWADYAEPMLRTATRSRAVHQAQGRAVALERFLTLMRTDPDAATTEAWFAERVRATEAAADEAAAETAAVAGAFDRPLPISEDTFRRVAAAAAREGRVRGEALQLADLRRTAGNYFRRRGYDERTLAFDRGDGSEPVPDERLVASVESRLGWAGLRQAILRPRTCAQAEAEVTCAPEPPGTGPVVITEGEGLAPPPLDPSILPGDNIRWSEPRMRSTDLLKRRPGW